ncbi:MAG: GNAT family N-acetyltransferase, partial [Chloroflexi bacterium]|nr:GNAT family N-acetyltransferase [Chloroflexota bacterium]
MIQYRENNAISADALIALYNSVGWSGYTDHPEKMARLLDGSLWYLSAYHE